MEENNMYLYEKFSRIQWLLHRYQQHHHQEHGPMADPTRGQGRVLAMLKIQPEISTKDLSYLLGIRQQSLAELLNKLEKNGYITRKQSEADKRVILIQLTEKGKHEKQENSDFGDIFTCLNEDEQTLFGEYLDRIIAALEVQVGAEPDEAASDWMNAARERFGEQFELLFSQHQGGRHVREGFDPREKGCDGFQRPAMHGGFPGRDGRGFGRPQDAPPPPHKKPDSSDDK